MNEFLLLTAVLLAVSVALQRLPQAAQLADHLNWWVLYIALPALVLQLVPHLRFSFHFWYLPVSQWLAFGLAIVLFLPLARALRWPRERLAAVLLMASLNNTGFIGLPLVGALRGQEGMAMATLADQLGCFVALNVGGTLVACYFSGTTPTPRAIALQALRFPAFIALLVALGAHVAGGWPPAVEAVLQRVAGTLAPLALFSVGLRLKLRPVPGQRTAVALTLGWKLLLMPALVLAIGWAAGVRGLPLTVSVLEAGMAPMFSAAILARMHDFDPDFTDTTLSLGLLLSFLTVPAWALLLP